MPRCRKCQPVPEEVRRAADLLERRWLLSVLFAAMSGALRFNEFVEAIDGISPRMLTERLRDLEEAKLVSRTVALVGVPRPRLHAPRVSSAL